MVKNTSVDYTSIPDRLISKFNGLLKMSSANHCVLLLLGHGSSTHPNSSASVKMHADALRKRGRFDEVHFAFLKEDPRIEDALGEIDSDQIVVVPDFLAEGYFTQQVIPDLLKLGTLPKPLRVRYCDPVGVHSFMQELLHQAALDVMGNWQPEDITLLVVGHGSNKNAQSKQSLLDHLAVLRGLTKFAQIADLWLEEPPLVTDWSMVATQKKIIVVPFLLSDGQHGGGDIPEAFGVGGGKGGGDDIYGVTHHLGETQLRVTHSLGTFSRFAEAVEMVDAY